MGLSCLTKANDKEIYTSAKYVFHSSSKSSFKDVSSSWCRKR